MAKDLKPVEKEEPSREWLQTCVNSARTEILDLQRKVNFLKNVELENAFLRQVLTSILKLAEKL